VEFDVTFPKFSVEPVETGFPSIISGLFPELKVVVVKLDWAEYPVPALLVAKALK
jgi:hypothetical protein